MGRDGRRRYDAGSRDRLVAACLEPGVSVSRLALDHGVNANLLRKWIRNARERRAEARSSTAFIPVEVTTDCGQQSNALALDLAATGREERQTKPARIGPLSSPAKMSASLPNGVKLTLECDDVDALTAIIGALGHVQTGR